MKLRSIRNTLVAGVLLLLPIFAIVSIVQRIWKAISGFGDRFAAAVGVETVGGVSTGPVLTTMILLAALYVAGLLARVAMIGRLRSWLDTHILNFIPGYVQYRTKMEERLLPPADARQAVLVRIEGNWKPGLVIEARGGKSVVFLPRTPDTDSGEVCVVADQDLRPVAMETEAFKKSIRLSGRGLAI